MYTDYESPIYNQNNQNNQNQEKEDENFYKSIREDNNYSKPRRNIFGILWKIILVILIFVLLFLVLIKFGVLSLTSSVLPELITLNQTEIGIKKGSGYQLVATVLPENASNKNVTYESSDPRIASVNEVTGYIEAHKDGQAIITAKTSVNQKSTTCIVNVGNVNILVSGISINDKDISLAAGYTYTLGYKVTPENATEINMNFSSSDSSIATVDKNGVIKGVKAGNAIITITSSNGVSDTANVTVYKKGEETVVSGENVKTLNYTNSISLSEKELSLKIGSTGQLMAIITPKNANQKVTWSSSNSSVATVSDNGLVTAIGEGSATITAKTIDNKFASCTVKVGNYAIPTKRIYITTNYASIQKGYTKQLYVAFEPSDAVDRTIVWSSSNFLVATVDNNGVVKGIDVGTAEITAKTADGKFSSKATIDVQGVGKVVDIKSLSFAKSSYDVGVNSTRQLTPVYNPTNATYKSVSFTSSDPSIASVDNNGVVRGNKEGNVVITATSINEGITAKVNIVVKYIPSVSVSLNSTSVNLSVGETYSLISTVNPENASNKQVTYIASDPNIVSVTRSGIITGLSKGSTTITVTPNGGGSPSTCLVTVN